MLSIDQLNKTYADGTQALNNISLQLPHGMVGLLGPNGAGKSSLMRTLAALQPADSGNLVFDGIDILRSPDSLRQVLGYLPQAFGVYPHMSCTALLEHIAILKGLDAQTRAERIPYLLELTNLANVAHKKVANYSGGMKQRFGIAQALLNDPKLLILDEPTAGLDPMERERFHQMLVELSQDRLILLSTHIVEDVENLCPHVAIMIGGKIVASDNVSTLLQPLNACIWQTSVKASLPSHALLLHKSFQYGQASLRVFCPQRPSPCALACDERLQDRYFFELGQGK
jgi:ABC-2 type transport system ATP-binding protein